MAITVGGGDYLDLEHLPLYLYGGYKVFAPGERHVTRCYPHDVLLVILSGSLHFIEDGEPITVQAGEYYLQYHMKSQVGEEVSDAVYYYFDFYGQRTHAPKQALPGRGVYTADVLPICERLLALDCAEPDVSNTQKATVFHELLCHLHRRQAAVLSTSHLAIALCDYLDAHYTERLPLEDVARHFNYSTDYLIRFFKIQYGITPHQYITQRRMIRAKVLLAEGGSSMNEVANACGYTDYSAFWRAFQRANGVTPGEWLRQNESVKKS